MKVRTILATGTVVTLLSSPAFAEDGSLSRSATSKVSVQAQLEVLPVGSATAKLGDVEVTTDADVAYGISGMIDFAITPNISIGLAPRLILNVTNDDDNDTDSTDKAIDLRARLRGHFAVSPGVEVYAAVLPGYTIVLSSLDDVTDAKGFAIGGAAGVTYDVAPTMFVGGEIGYQRAFTSADFMILGQTLTTDVDLSYMHIGIAAGARF